MRISTARPAGKHVRGIVARLGYNRQEVEQRSAEDRGSWERIRSSNTWNFTRNKERSTSGISPALVEQDRTGGCLTRSVAMGPSQRRARSRRGFEGEPCGPRVPRRSSPGSSIRKCLPRSDKGAWVVYQDPRVFEAVKAPYRGLGVTPGHLLALRFRPLSASPHDDDVKPR